jgi:ketosteroid isomerase-like protein
VAQGDAVVAIGRYSAQVASTGKSFDVSVMLAFEIQNGKIARHTALGDTAAVAHSYRSVGAAAR